jgi:hypothetical protein
MADIEITVAGKGDRIICDLEVAIRELRENGDANLYVEGEPGEDNLILHLSDDFDAEAEVEDPEASVVTKAERR